MQRTLLKRKLGRSMHRGSGPEKHGNPHVPTAKMRHQVELMAALHNTHKDIAMVMQISDVTLEKYYSQELRAGL